MKKTQIKELLEVTLMDHQINEKERNVLIHKAQSLGLDPQEFDLVLDAVIQARASNKNFQLDSMVYFQEASHHDKSQAQSPKINVQKCPSCNDTILGLSRVCASCGFVLPQESNSDLQRHIKQLEDFLFELKKAANPSLAQSIKPVFYCALTFGLYFVYKKLRGKSVFSPEIKALDHIILDTEKQIRLTSTAYGEAPEIKRIISDIETEKNNIIIQHKKVRKLRIILSLAYMFFWLLLMIFVPEPNDMKIERLLDAGKVTEARSLFKQLPEDEINRKSIESKLIDAEADVMIEAQVHDLISQKNFAKARSKAAAINNKKLQKILNKKIDTNQTLND